MFLPHLASFFEGFGTSLGLIIAIGPQNAFLIRQGLMRQNVLPALLFFILSDIFVILIGVQQIGQLLTENDLIYQTARWSGVTFLIAYGLMSFKQAFESKQMGTTNKPAPKSLWHTLLICAGVTFLNPNMVLDTLLLGSLGSQFLGIERDFYAAGAVIASILWFCGLAFGAKALSPYFKKPATWRVLDCVVGTMMMSIAVLMYLKF